MKVVVETHKAKATILREGDSIIAETFGVDLATAEKNAQRIADALNACERAEATAYGNPYKCDKCDLLPKRDPDRVRLAAAALCGLLSDPNCITKIEELAKYSVKNTDAVLAQLDATAKKGTT